MDTHTAMFKHILAIGTLLLVTPVVDASLFITEIMYNPPGEDGGSEWVEMVNRGEEEVAIRDVRFTVDGVVHTVQPTGRAFLNPKQVAVIAQNKSSFLSEYPLYQGIILLSSFSLKQDGHLHLSTTDGSHHTVTYKATVAANDTGGSLHVVEDHLIPAPETPGILATNPLPFVQEHRTVAKKTLQPAPQLQSSTITELPPHREPVAVMDLSHMVDTPVRETVSNHMTLLRWIAIVLTVIAVELLCILSILLLRSKTRRNI